MEKIMVLFYEKPKNELLDEENNLCLEHNFLFKAKKKIPNIFRYDVAFNDFRTIISIKNNIKKDLNREGYRCGRDFEFLN